MTPVGFCLTLHKTYYHKGFFNVPVSVDRYVTEDKNVFLVLGREKKISARVDRNQNRNGTARICGRKELSDWFQQHYQQGDKVWVDLSNPREIRIGTEECTIRKNS